VHDISKAIKRRAVDTLEPPINIINQELRVANIAVPDQIANKDTLRKMVQRARNDNNTVPAVPRDLIEPDKYQSYQPASGADERFLLIDTSPALNRILVFGREHDRTCAGEMKTVYGDGTFKTAPPLFTQIYVILAKRQGFVFPVLYALLPNKEQQTYVRLFNEIRRE